MWQKYIIPATLQEGLQALAAEAGSARVISGGTDILLEMERGVRKGIHTLVDISRLGGLDQISLDEDGLIHLGPNVTHNQVAGSSLLHEKAFPLVQAAWQVGSPQIRNRGTVAGNLITASPANDTITPLMAMDASVTLQSQHSIRRVPLSQFYTGVRKTVLQPDEMLVDISFRSLPETARGTYIKYALRKAQAISLINLAVILEIHDGVIRHSSVTLGAVAPTIIHAVEVEEYLLGQKFDNTLLDDQAAALAGKASRAIDDIRGSAAYRGRIVSVMFKRALESLLNHTEKDGIPDEPVLLWGKADQNPVVSRAAVIDDAAEIRTTINGKPFAASTGQSKTLLRFLREEAGLVGVKEGCGEGECGACTIHLDGKAVMACMVPAGRAHGAEITTIEGVSSGDQLHPVQIAFVEQGAVQCGYCTPGFVMSAIKLLEEVPHPDRDQIKQGITGNLCRCTGYYKIVEAIEKASEVRV
jgi:carbon-monoxide dehydrogenase medium subunit